MATTPRHKKRPRIGITGPAKGGQVLWYFTRLAVKWGGGKPRSLIAGKPYNLTDYDGFVISGGGDINPELYGEGALLQGTKYDPERDRLEQEVIRYAIEHQKPILGICRGMQMMNVTLGGSLYQEAKDVLEDFLPSESLISKIIGRREVMVEPDSMLFQILGEYTHYNVNSIHHQAVNRLGKHLRVVAKEENNLIQAVEQESKAAHPFLLGVQWHPELMLYVKSARNLFKALIKASL